MTIKKCSKCQIKKDQEKFYFDKTNNNFKSRCMCCSKIARKKRYHLDEKGSIKYLQTLEKRRSRVKTPQEKLKINEYMKIYMRNYNPDKIKQFKINRKYKVSLLRG